jgi:para-nitrobenzyl esterase
VLRFGGVPYARAARFGLPEPARWSEPLDATRPGPAPPQTTDGLDLVPGMVAARQDEDCLTAEVCTPSLDGRLPVIVWVPGGSYRIGAASLPVYDGAALAAGPAVVIGVNSRLGAFGWLAADGVPSNLALRDLRAAVHWVHETAPAFGGDPDHVVVMGESAGSGAVAHLLATGDLPISGAILQSGAPAGTLDAETAAWVAEQMLAAAQVTTVAELRDLPVDAVLAAQQHTVAAALGKVGMMPFHPWVDGDLLHDSPVRAELTAVPLGVGTTAHEMELFRDQVPELPEDVAVSFLTPKAAALGITDESVVRDALHAAGGDLVEAVADLELHLPNDMLSREHRARGNTVWNYRFDWEAPVRRACHALDLPFTFGTLDSDTWRDFAGAHDPAADALSARMRAAWTSFARDGAPSDDVVGRWPDDALVHLGRDASIGPDAVSDRLRVWTGA